MTNQAKYTFKMPIGDWSSDGHGYCDYYKVSSELPLEEVREAHFLIKDKSGINLSELCSDYQDSHIPFEVVKKLLELGFNKDDIIDFDEELFNNAIEEDDPEEYNDNTSGVDSETVAKIWVFLLNYANPELKLNIIPEKEEMLVFYGSDKKGRHISGPGYGCFYL